MSERSPIHPALAPLARAAKAFDKALRSTGAVTDGPGVALRDAVGRDRGWLRPEHRAGELAEFDLGGPIYHRVSNRTSRPLVSLHVYGVAADRLTTGINRLYPEA